MHIPRPTLRLDITRWTCALLLAGIVGAGCSGPNAAGESTGPTPESDALDVVATTSVLADLVRQVGGSHVDVTSLVPPGGEVHTFDPTPADIARVAEADLVFTNGLGLDDWVANLARDSGSQAPIVALGEDLDGVSYLEGDGQAGTANPHLWMDVRNAIEYTKRIGQQLAAVDAAHASAYEAGTASSDERLSALDDWARDQIGTIPAERRKVVSFHDAFPYLAQAYGLEIVGTVIDAPGQDPSAGEIAGLIDAIRASNATALFGEAQFNPQLAQTIAAETGIAVVTDLYTDSLGSPPADTYEGMIRWDVERVVGALQP